MNKRELIKNLSDGDYGPLGYRPSEAQKDIILLKSAADLKPHEIEQIPDLLRAHEEKQKVVDVYNKNKKKEIEQNLLRLKWDCFNVTGTELGDPLYEDLWGYCNAAEDTIYGVVDLFLDITDIVSRYQ
jgi:hypothetical protein